MIVSILLVGLRELRQQVLPDLGQFVDVDGSLSINTAHDDVRVLLLIGEGLPALPHESLPLFAFEIRVHLLHNWDFFATEKPICSEKLEFPGWLDCVVVAAVADPMNLLTESIDFFLHIFDLLETLLLSELSQLVKLIPLGCRQLQVPLGFEMFRNFLLAQMRHPLLNFVEILVFEDFESRGRVLFRHFAQFNFNLDFCDSVLLRLRQNRVRHHCRVVLVRLTLPRLCKLSCGGPHLN